MNLEEKENITKEIEYLPLNSHVNNIQLSDFIKSEIEPYLAISLAHKLKVSNIDEYALKLIEMADGYIAYRNEEIYGVVAAYIRNRFEPDKVYLPLLGVKNDVRHCGIGGSLLKKLSLDIPSECILYTNVDEKNKNACAYYKRMGFQFASVQNGRWSIYLRKD